MQLLYKMTSYVHHMKWEEFLKCTQVLQKMTVCIASHVNLRDEIAPTAFSLCWVQHAPCTCSQKLNTDIIIQGID